MNAGRWSRRLMRKRRDALVYAKTSVDLYERERVRPALSRLWVAVYVLAALQVLTWAGLWIR
jgi:hypothetical protein